jgi:hypothetical protein
MAYLFGMWDSINDFIREGQEGLRLDRNGNSTNTVNYVDSSDYKLSDVSSNAEWYEVDTSQPLDEQLDINRISKYVNQQALTNYKDTKESMQAKLDLGGNLQKDRLKATEDATGIFSFGLAAPTLYRVVEWYIEELDVLADMEKGSVSETNKNFYYKEIASASNPNPKTFKVRRQQKGTFDMLKNVPNVFLKSVGDNFFAASQNKGIGRDGKEYRLYFGTRTKKIYLKRPNKGGEPQYVDIFVIAGGLGELNSMGMMAKVTPIIMLAQQLEQAGSKVRIYGLRGYSVSGDQVYYSWVAKEYGAPIDLQAISTAIADPRFFRYAMWQNSEGISRKRYGKERTGYGSTLYKKRDYERGFTLYKNYLMEQKTKGVNKTKVKNKELFIVGGLPNPQNDWSSNENAIKQEFNRISDMAELVLATKPEKSLRRIIKRERDAGQTDTDIRDRLAEIIGDAFLTVPFNNNLPDAEKPYADSKEDVDKAAKRLSEITETINRIMI